MTGMPLAIGMVSALLLLTAGHGTSMESWKTWLKATGALVTAVVLFQWIVLPACPCQLRAMFALTLKSVAETPGGFRNAPGPDQLAQHGPRKSCSCSDHAAEPFHAASSEVNAPVVAMVPIAGDRLCHGQLLPLEGISRPTSGTDPPGGGVRLHLRLQVFLV